MVYRFDLGAPVNTALFVYILYAVQRILFPPLSNRRKGVASEFREGYTWMPVKHPATVLFREYTPRSLAEFDGRRKDGDGGRILLAIDRVVFDVSAGRSFYGPHGMYGNFAGRDASRGMAKQSFDKEMLTSVDGPIDKLEDLTVDEIENMKGWIDHFSNKYIICGRLVENEEHDECPSDLTAERVQVLKSSFENVSKAEMAASDSGRALP